MKTKAFTLFILAAMICLGDINAQETFNKVDENGLKQGRWIKKFENGNVLYDGIFKDDKPIGEFKRYYISGQLISVLTYSESNNDVDAMFYYPNGFLAAKGGYISQKKEGTWTFYSEKQADCVICIENYINNLKEGKSTKYHLNGNKAEELNYQNDLKDGEWIQYYTDEVVCVRSKYSKGKLLGKFETYHTSGFKEIIGTYMNDVRIGLWQFFNEDGSLKRNIDYINGVASNDADLIKEQTDYLDMLEKNGGKIEDPAKTGIIW